MRDLQDDPDPPPSRYGLMIAALGMLAELVFVWSFLGGAGGHGEVRFQFPVRVSAIAASKELTSLIWRAFSEVGNGLEGPLGFFPVPKRPPA